MTTWEIVWPPGALVTPYTVQPGCRDDLRCMSAYLLTSPTFSQPCQRCFVLWMFTVLQSKELLCRPVVRLLVSTIEDRGQSPRRDKGRTMTWNSAFPLVSKQVGRLAISVLWWICPNVPLNFFTFKNISLWYWNESQLWNWAFPPISETKLLYSWHYFPSTLSTR